MAFYPPKRFEIYVCVYVRTCGNTTGQWAPYIFPLSIGIDGVSKIVRISEIEKERKELFLSLFEGKIISSFEMLRISCLLAFIGVFFLSCGF